MKASILKTKSYEFAFNVVSTYKSLIAEKEVILSKQLLRSGTSIGANIREANNAQSKADFTHKLSISLKASDETEYWLELLKDSFYIENFQKLKNQNQEINPMLISSIKTLKKINL
ncbi:MAG: four helix bundle protein [Bacteroidetes bacterium]|nr:four helix bundle protein [Bacteroidota bacterium]